MKNNQGKSLEETIKELRKKYKNVPSPLSEDYQRFRSHMTPQQSLGQNSGPINPVLGNFRPAPKSW